jgi:5-hydroxyisourate hydrolase
VTTLSTHVLDTELGRPAAGMPVRVMRSEHEIAAARTNADGRVAELAILDADSYCIEFDVAAYLSLHQRPAPFLKRVRIDFEVQPGAAYYHIPLLLSPYAFTSYRGS